MKILVISPTPTYPTTAGNRARIRASIALLKEAGHEVHFAHIEREPGDASAMHLAYGPRFHRIPYRKPPRTKGLGWRCLRWAGRRFKQAKWYVWGIDDWYDDASSAMLCELQSEHRYDAVLVQYVFMSQAFECFDDEVLKIIDTHDVMTHRARIYTAAGRKPQWFSTLPSQEGRALDRAHVVIAIQDKEAEFFRTITTKKVIASGHVTSIDNRYVGRESRQHDALIFVASENPINVDGIRHFLDHVFPLIRSRAPSVELLLAGRVCEEIPDQPGVRKLGTVDDIAGAYGQADIVINPVRYGTGLNIKSIEALGFGMPMVASASGGRGLEACAGDAFLLAQDDANFADHVVALLSSEQECDRLSRNAVRFAAAWNRRQLASLLACLPPLATPGDSLDRPQPALNSVVEAFPK